MLTTRGSFVLLIFQENLVCSDALLVSHAQLAFYFGVLVGSIIFGQLADTYVLDSLSTFISSIFLTQSCEVSRKAMISN